VKQGYYVEIETCQEEYTFILHKQPFTKHPNVIKAVTENQVKNYNTAKDLIKKEKALAKKLEKKK
jgi:23S rRNA A1618 N6-methylase RlmF